MKRLFIYITFIFSLLLFISDCRIVSNLNENELNSEEKNFVIQEQQIDTETNQNQNQENNQPPQEDMNQDQQNTNAQEQEEFPKSQINSNQTEQIQNKQEQQYSNQQSQQQDLFQGEEQNQQSSQNNDQNLDNSDQNQDEADGVISEENSNSEASQGENNGQSDQDNNPQQIPNDGDNINNNDNQNTKINKPVKKIKTPRQLPSQEQINKYLLPFYDFQLLEDRKRPPICNRQTNDSEFQSRRLLTNDLEPVRQISTDKQQYYQIINKYKKYRRPNALNDLFKGQQQELLRYDYYKQNVNQINSHNKRMERTFNMWANQFIDLSQKQFTSIMGYNEAPPDIPVQVRSKTPPKKKNRLLTIFQEASHNKLVDHTCFDYTVRDQGVCGSCYLMAALDVVALTYRIYPTKRSHLYANFSVQELISCPKPERRVNLRGCAGGQFGPVFQYFRSIGVGPDSFYPYTHDSQVKNLNPVCDPVVKTKEYNKYRRTIKSYTLIEQNNCVLIRRILQGRPLAATINTFGLRWYRNGIYSGFNGPHNHAVIIIGYYPEKGYKIRNSWGEKWGMRGYAFVDKSTGICKKAMYVTLHKQTHKLLGCCQPRDVTKKNPDKLASDIIKDGND